MKKIGITFFAVLSTFCSFAQVGIGTTSPNTTLDVRGSLAANSRIFSTTSESVQSTDFALLFTGNSACTLTLPDAATCIGRIIHIKNTKTGIVPVLTIATIASQTIDGQSTWLLDDPNESVNFVSNGTNWLIMGQSLPSGSGTSWTQGGNAVTSVKAMGTTTNYDLPFITNNTEQLRLLSNGDFTIKGTNRRIIFTTPGGDPDAVIEHRAYNGNDFNEMLFYIGNDASTSYGPDRIRMVGEEFRFQSFNNAGNSTLTNAETSTNLNTNMYISPGGNVSVGTTTFNVTVPEKFLVDGGSSSNFINAIVAKGSSSKYVQLNVQNTNSSSTASSDVVATANNGDETKNYIDMGINSQYNGQDYFGNQNDCYLYAMGNSTNGGNLAIGTATPGRDIIFMVGGGSSANERMRIDGLTGNVGIGTSSPNSTLSVSGSVSVAYTLPNNAYTITANDYVIINTTNSAKNWTLPNPTTCAGRIYKLINHGTASITFLNYSVYIADGTTTNTLGNATGSNTMEILSDGAYWRKIN